MAEGRADFTNTFRALSDPAGTPRDQFLDQTAFDAWALRWQARLAEETDPHAQMSQVNPFVIPRNHRIEQMIAAAVSGDYALFNRLNEVLQDPYTTQPDALDLTRPPSQGEIVRQTFCGT